MDTYIKRVPNFQDRRAKRELQDATQRLFELCVVVAGRTVSYSSWQSPQPTDPSVTETATPPEGLPNLSSSSDGSVNLV
jgi:hypothetical protein